MQRQREEEAEARRQARAAEKVTAARRPVVPAAAAAVAAEPVRSNEPDKWRRGAVPPLPASRSAVEPTPPRSDSPAAGAAPKFRPGAVGSSWREKEEKKRQEAARGAPTPAAVPSRVATGTDSLRSGSPAPAAPKKDDDGFQTVASAGKYRPPRRAV